MRVGIDCRTILNPGRGEQAGLGHYTYALVKHVLKADPSTEYVLLFDSRMRRETTTEFHQPNVKIRYFPFSSYRKFLPFAYSHMLSAAELLKERLDVFHSPSTSMPLTYTKATVVTVHDLAIYLNPSWFPTQMFSTRLLVPQTVKRAKKIIAVSESAKKNLDELFSVDPKKVTVIHEGVDTQKLDLKDKHTDVHKKFELPSKYLLFIGTVEPRKNLAALIDAYAALLKVKEDMLRDIPLVIAGGVGYMGDDILEKIRGMKLGQQIRYLGYVTHNEKLNLMSNALAFVFPSLHEGFGLPVVEAMNLGTPVLTSNVSALPEVAGNAALLVDPTNPAAIATGIEKLVTDSDLRQSLRIKGFERAKAFSWDFTARQTIEVYRSMVKEKLLRVAEPVAAEANGRGRRASK